MKTVSLLVACAVLAVVFAQQAKPICDNDASCNTFNTEETYVCLNAFGSVDPLQKTCQLRNTTAYGQTSGVGTRCSDTINHSGNVNTPQCGVFAAPGCFVDSANTTYVKCMLGSTRNADLNGLCQPNNATDTVTRYAGERCDPSATNPTITCVFGTHCIDRVCRPGLKLGDNCLNSRVPCGAGPFTGMMCDGDLCVVAASKYPQEPCHTNFACTSGLCQDGKCTEVRSIPCYSNAECAEGDKRCYISPGATRGYCTATSNIATKRYFQCVVDKCPFGTNTTCTACDTEIIDAICASECIKRPDMRIPTNQFPGFTGSVYNCQTRTKSPASGCSIAQLVTGCDTAPKSGAFTQTLSVFVGLATILMLLF